MFTRAHRFTFNTLSFLGFVCFCYAILILGFRIAFRDPVAQTINAATLASLWAICPPAWFWVERSIWETPANRRELEKGQERARDFWLGLGALVLFLADKRFEHCG
jgi:hypothetical protein